MTDLSLNPNSTNPSTSNPNMANIEWREGDMPYSNAFGDYYYSRADGRAECDHVFIKANQLNARWQEFTDNPFVIGELGFGTGLNFLETVRQFDVHRSSYESSDVHLEFHSFELQPLAPDMMAKALSKWPELIQYTKTLLEIWPQNRQALQHGRIDFKFSAHIDLYIYVGFALEQLTKANFMADAWFLDGFAPARNDDMWSAELMQSVADHTKIGGTFGTYTAAGRVRRRLQAAGFEVKKCKGHAGKRDMSIGIKISPNKS